MRELGGYLPLEMSSGREWYRNCIALNSARNAVAYLIQARKIAKIYLPWFLCNTVSDVCKENGCEVAYYQIHRDFTVDFQKNLLENEYLYVVNFYGQLDDAYFLKLKKFHERIIVDNVQAFFRAPLKEIDTIYSCRKFFGVPDGAYLLTSAKLPYLLQEDCSAQRMAHLLGAFETTTSQFYENFQNNELLIDGLPLRSMSKLTHRLLCSVDYEAVRRKRSENFTYLHESLAAKNLLNLQNTIAPYMYPFYVENGMLLRKKLLQKKIYIPVLWPEVCATVTKDTVEWNYANSILPLPVDQRYGLQEMDYIVNQLCDL